jgi:putative membrane protein
MDNAVYHRIHPLTILVEAVRFFGKFAYVIVIILISRSTKSGSGDWLEIALAALGGLSILAAVLRYYFTIYSLDSQKMVLKTGLIYRQTRTIPLDRIQNVELSRGILHQMLDLADLKIETAGGTQAEAHLSALSVAEAQRLKDFLQRARPVDARAEGLAPFRTIYAASMKDLLIMGATENRIFLILAALSAPILFAQQMGREDLLETVGKSAVEGARGLGENLPYIAVYAAIAVVVFGWIASIVSTIIKYNGFVLRSIDDQFERKYGMLTTVESIVPLPRIQTLCIEAPFIRRLLGYCTIHAGLAGSMHVQNQQATTATSILCMLIRRTDASGYVRRVFPHLDLDSIQWQPVSRVAIRRGAFGMAIPLLVLLGAWVYYAHDNRWWLLSIPIVALSAWYGLARFRSMGYATTEGFFLTRSGILYHKTHIAPHGKLQWLAVDQNPIQRRYRIADVNVGTAAVVGIQLGRPSVSDVEFDKAVALQDYLSARAEAAGMWMPDGV